MYAKYTVVLRDLMVNEKTSPLLDKALSTYPLYEAKKKYELIPQRSELNQKILNHYKYREIGFETIGRFLDELEITMCEIMPYYNELFKTVEIMADLPNPFDNVDVIEEFRQNSQTLSTNNTNSSGSNTSESIGTSSSESEAINETLSKNIHTNTPQNTVSIPAENMDSVQYASDVSWNKGTGTDSNMISNTSSDETTNISESDSHSEGHSSSETSHTYTKKGNQGVNTYAHDMNEFRTSIIDIMDQIIQDQRINELFMCIY